MVVNVSDLTLSAREMRDSELNPGCPVTHGLHQALICVEHSIDGRQAFVKESCLSPLHWPHLSLFAACAVLAACSSTPSNTSATGPADEQARLLQLASDVERRGDPGSAVALYERAAVVSNQDPQVMRELGSARLAAGDAQGAARAFRGALAKQPDDAQALLGLGTAQLQAGEPTGAAQTLSRAAPRVDSASAYNRWGAAAVMAGDTEAAVNAFRQASQREPGNLDIRTNFALALALNGEFAPAQAEIAQVVRSPLVKPSHQRQQLLILTLAGKDVEAGRVFADMPRTQRDRLLTQARAIRALDDPAQRARAVGVLARDAR